MAGAVSGGGAWWMARRAPAMNSPACSHVGQAAGGVQGAEAQAVQQHAVARQQVELTGGAARVVPVADERVDAVLDVLLVAGDLGRHARRAHVEGLERRPVHPLDARQLDQHVALGVERRQFALWERADDAVGAVGNQAGAVGGDDRELVGLAHLADRGHRLVDALEPDVWRCPRRGRAADRRRAARVAPASRRRACRCRCARDGTARSGAVPRACPRSSVPR